MQPTDDFCLSAKWEVFVFGNRKARKARFPLYEKNCGVHNVVSIKKDKEKVYGKEE